MAGSSKGGSSSKGGGGSSSGSKSSSSAPASSPKSSGGGSSSSAKSSPSAPSIAQAISSRTTVSAPSAPSKTSAAVDKSDVKSLISKLEDKNKTAQQIQSQVEKKGELTSKARSFLSDYVKDASSTSAATPGTKSYYPGIAITPGQTSTYSAYVSAQKPAESTAQQPSQGPEIYKEPVDDLFGENSVVTSGELSGISAGLEADAKKEVAKLNKEAYLGVAAIESKGKLDLQPIINAGLKEIESIRAASDEKVAKIGKAASMYGLISSVFG